MKDPLEAFIEKEAAAHWMTIDMGDDGRMINCKVASFDSSLKAYVFSGGMIALIGQPTTQAEGILPMLEWSYNISYDYLDNCEFRPAPPVFALVIGDKVRVGNAKNGFISGGIVTGVTEVRENHYDEMPCFNNETLLRWYNVRFKNGALHHIPEKAVTKE